MPPLTTLGIVLRYANYRDHDRMLTLLTPEHGRLDALSRGCRRPKSPLLPASESFAQGEFVLFHNNDKYTVTSCALEEVYYPLRLEPYRLTCASYLAGLCRAAAQPGEPAQELYGLLLQGLWRLTYAPEEQPLRVTSAFLLLYAERTGYRPRMNHCVHCGASIGAEEGAFLEVAAGGVACRACAGRDAYPLTGSQAGWMRAVLREGLGRNGNGSALLRGLEEDAEMFIALRRYVESRLETTIKVSKLLP